MSSYSAEMLAQQLAALGRDLDAEVAVLGELEETAADLEGEYRKLKSSYEDCMDNAFIHGEGGVDLRKTEARLACTAERALMQQA